MPRPQRKTRSTEQLKSLAETLASFRHDPYGWVMWAFPWGEPGTSLEDETGPDTWQRESLLSIGRSVAKTGKVQDATASGKGIGKSCEGAWLILWAMTTAPHTRGVVTANTFDQIRTKTWPELAKWFHLMLPPVREMFTLTATSIYSAIPECEKTWRVDAVSWSANNVEAFAGLHNKGRRILVLFDEASAIDDPVWDTTDGIMSDADTEVIWAVRGNPTRNTGRFRQCWGRQRALWTTRRIDSRTVKITDKAALNQQVETWGEDSDYVRKYIKGEFPNKASMQFIGGDVVEAAMGRTVDSYVYEPLIMGVDVARFGDDKTALTPRDNRIVYPQIVWGKLDTMQTAGKVKDYVLTWNEANPKRPFEQIAVDVIGIGAGVVDRLNEFPELNGIQIVGVNTSIKLDDGRNYNLRARIWRDGKDWLDPRNGPVSVTNDAELQTDLTSLHFGYRNGLLLIEAKDDAKKRGIKSPDRADSFMLTFAEPVVAHAGLRLSRRERNPRTV